MTSLAQWYDVSNKDKRFNVTFIPWKHFLDAMLNPETHGNMLVTLAQADCVIGGVDVSTAYM
jgi:hypothetical protein